LLFSFLACDVLSNIVRVHSVYKVSIKSSTMI